MPHKVADRQITREAQMYTEARAARPDQAGDCLGRGVCPMDANKHKEADETSGRDWGCGVPHDSKCAKPRTYCTATASAAEVADLFPPLHILRPHMEVARLLVCSGGSCLTSLAGTRFLTSLCPYWGHAAPLMFTSEVEALEGVQLQACHAHECAAVAGM